jgi:hypothetical protein
MNITLVSWIVWDVQFLIPLIGRKRNWCWIEWTVPAIPWTKSGSLYYVSSGNWCSWKNPKDVIQHGHLEPGKQFFCWHERRSYHWRWWDQKMQIVTKRLSKQMVGWKFSTIGLHTIHTDNPISVENIDFETKKTLATRWGFKKQSYKPKWEPKAEALPIP